MSMGQDASHSVTIIRKRISLCIQAALQEILIHFVFLYKHVNMIFLK